MDLTFIDFNVRNEKFRDLLIGITKPQHIDYCDSDGNKPCTFMIDGARVEFSPTDHDYKINGQRMDLPIDEAQLRRDIRHMNEHTEYLNNRKTL